MSGESDEENGPEIKVAFTVMSEVVNLGLALPLDDYQYQCAFREFPKAVKAHSSSLLDAIEASSRLVPKKRRLTMNRNGTKDQLHAFVMDDVDSLLENVDTMLDEVKGQRQDGDEQLEVAFGDSTADGGKSRALVSGRVVAKPQLAFDIPVDNRNEPFHAMLFSDDGVLTRGRPHVHPFHDLISGFKFPEVQLQPSGDRPYMPLAECPLRLIDDDEGLDELVAILASETEFAVDLEHHDLHSYQGITCLMQISTRTEDFIIDVLRLRSKMHRLNGPFLNPKILKVFHGANEDMRWLQKDFGLYVANMFDTGIALQMLHMPHGLAFAVDHFCQVRLDKKYQTADWRIRPLPREMIQYARQDTHYLLYCCDRLKALLLNSEARASTGNLFVHTLQESRRLCLTMYEKPVLDPASSYLDAMGKSLGGLSPVQLSVIRNVFNWRDAVARTSDECPMVIMHTSAILQIALRLPTAASDLLKALPSPISNWVRKDAVVLAEIVKQAFADNGVVDESLYRAETGSDGSAFGQRTGTRQLHVPGTGTLPSLDVGGVLVLPVDFSFAPTVNTSMQPSAWFTSTLSYLHRAGAAVPKVPLPGADVVIRKVLAGGPAPAASEDGRSSACDENDEEDEEDEEEEHEEGEEGNEAGGSVDMPFGSDGDMVRVERAPLPVGKSVAECFGLRGRPKGATFKRMDTGKRSRSGNVFKSKGKPKKK